MLISRLFVLTIAVSCVACGRSNPVPWPVQQNLFSGKPRFDRTVEKDVVDWKWSPHAPFAATCTDEAGSVAMLICRYRLQAPDQRGRMTLQSEFSRLDRTCYDDVEALVDRDATHDVVAEDGSRQRLDPSNYQATILRAGTDLLEVRVANPHQCMHIDYRFAALLLDDAS